MFDEKVGLNISLKRITPVAAVVFLSGCGFFLPPNPIYLLSRPTTESFTEIVTLPDGREVTVYRKLFLSELQQNYQSLGAGRTPEGEAITVVDPATHEKLPAWSQKFRLEPILLYHENNQWKLLTLPSGNARTKLEKANLSGYLNKNRQPPYLSFHLQNNTWIPVKTTPGDIEHLIGTPRNLVFAYTLLKNWTGNPVTAGERARINDIVCRPRPKKDPGCRLTMNSPYH